MNRRAAKFWALLEMHQEVEGTNLIERGFHPKVQIEFDKIMEKISRRINRYGDVDVNYDGTKDE